MKGAGWPVPYLTPLIIYAPGSGPVSDFDWRLTLDNGVPVEVVLDVVGSEQASHLKVSRGEGVLLLLLAQLAVMTWT